MGGRRHQGVSPFITSQYYFIIKACTEQLLVLFCTTTLAQSTSQYYFALHTPHFTLHKPHFPLHTNPCVSENVTGFTEKPSQPCKHDSNVFQKLVGMCRRSFVPFDSSGLLRRRQAGHSGMCHSATFTASEQHSESPKIVNLGRQKFT